MPAGNFVIRLEIECNISSLNDYKLTKKSFSHNMESTIRYIPVRSRREAMDLALALASQAIEPTILKTEEGWALEVSGTEYEKALQTIEHYRRENRYWRGWSWQHHFVKSGIWFHWGSIFWCAAVLTLYYWNKVRFPQLEAIGRMESARVQSGEWWRLFTAITLHADISHLSANVSTGFLLLGIAMATYGPGFAVIASYLAGAGGNFAALGLYPITHRSLGASGMVMGALGLIAVQTIAHWRQNFALSNRLVLRSFAAAVSIFILLGFSPNSDLVAHGGGFIFGGVLGCGLQMLPNSIRRNSAINQICILCTVGWVILTWWLATSRS